MLVHVKRRQHNKQKMRSFRKWPCLEKFGGFFFIVPSSLRACKQENGFYLNLKKNLHWFYYFWGTMMYRHTHCDPRSGKMDSIHQTLNVIPPPSLSLQWGVCGNALFLFSPPLNTNLTATTNRVTQSQPISSWKNDKRHPICNGKPENSQTTSNNPNVGKEKKWKITILYLIYVHKYRYLWREKRYSLQKRHFEYLVETKKPPLSVVFEH